jgi:hypothetical protein
MRSLFHHENLIIAYGKQVLKPSVYQGPSIFVSREGYHARQHSWLRHYATSWKVMGSSPDEVDFFNLSNPSSRTIALGLTQPLTK